MLSGMKKTGAGNPLGRYLLKLDLDNRKEEKYLGDILEGK
jgi:hypothetical protein